MDYIKFYLHDNQTMINNFITMVNEGHDVYDPEETPDYNFEFSEMADISDWHYNAYYSVYDYIKNSGVPDVATAINQMADQVLKYGLKC